MCRRLQLSAGSLAPWTTGIQGRCADAEGSRGGELVTDMAAFHHWITEGPGRYLAMPLAFALMAWAFRVSIGPFLDVVRPLNGTVVRMTEPSRRSHCTLHFRERSRETAIDVVGTICRQRLAPGSTLHKPSWSREIQVAGRSLETAGIVDLATFAMGALVTGGFVGLVFVAGTRRIWQLRAGREPGDRDDVRLILLMMTGALLGLTATDGARLLERWRAPVQSERDGTQETKMGNEPIRQR